MPGLSLVQAPAVSGVILQRPKRLDRGVDRARIDRLGRLALGRH